VPVPGMSAPFSPRAGDLRVATLNLWGGYYPVREHVIGRIGPGSDRHPAWSDRQSALAAGLRELQPDLVAFQEALKTDDYDQVVELLGPGYHLAHQTGREADGSGASIASRWPFEAVHEVDLHLAPRIQGEFPCVTLLAEVAAPEPVGPLLFANHNPNFGLDFEHERELQAVTAARAIQEFVGRRRLHVVVAGDFDTTPDAASGRFWRGRQSLESTSVCYWDAWESTDPGDPGHTFTPDNPLLSQGTWPQERGRRIDHILVRCVDHGPTLDVVACARIFDQPVDSVWATDHFGVVADLAVPTRTPTVIS
jgi:endonuclease/exonuclease/phosphatase family metal-dependent hydrolase